MVQCFRLKKRLFLFFEIFKKKKKKKILAHIVALAICMEYKYINAHKIIFTFFKNVRQNGKSLFFRRKHCSKILNFLKYYRLF